MKRIIAAGVALVFGATVAQAGAVLEKSSGQVLVNHGAGFVAAAGGVDLPEGSRILVKDAGVAKGEASLRFADGCTVPMVSGQVLTITDQSPCAFNAQAEVGGLSVPLLAGGVIVVGAVIGGVVLATNNHNSGNNSGALAALLAAQTLSP
jgi:hypothetical protein